MDGRDSKTASVQLHGIIAGKKAEFAARSSRARVSVVGLGCAGTNVVSWVKRNGGIAGKLIAANTDASQLGGVAADRRIILGDSVLQGRGTGGYPERGVSAAKASMGDLIRETNGSNVLFLCAGLGGGTGTGGVEACSESLQTDGRLVIGVVGLPFPVEGHRCENAKKGLDRLRRHCDTVVAVDHSELARTAGDLPLQDALGVANELMGRFVRDLSETMTDPSLINVDYSDLKMVMQSRGIASIGVGVADGEDRVERAVRRAVEGQLLDIRDITKAKGVLVHLSVGSAITLREVTDAGDVLKKTLPPSAKVVWGARTDASLNGHARATVVLTGVDRAPVSPGGFRFALGPIRIGKMH